MLHSPAFSLAVCLLLVLVLCAPCALADALPLPASSGESSPALALKALALCTGNTAEATRQLLEADGFTVLLQQHFDKAADDPAHTCAFTIARTETQYGGETRPLIAVMIRGTNDGEWYSNFDFAPSHSADAVFAENFLFAAQDVFLSLDEILKDEENPLLLVAGHSRGAACANLLGVLLDAAYDPANVFVYTFATPTTVRGAAAQAEYPNIFNYINPCDVVTKMPLESLGYRRAGTDIVLQNDAELAAKVDGALESLAALSPDIPSYYEKRHSLTGPGLADDGLTAFDAMLALGTSLSGLTGQNADMPALSAFDALSPESDFAPLAALLEKIAARDSQTAQTVFAQHMPQMYAQLMTQGE